MRQLIARDFIYIAVCVILVTFAIVERIFEDDLLQWNNRVTKDWQSHNSWFLEHLMWFASYPFWMTIAIVPVLYEIMIAHDKVLQLWTIFYLTSGVYISANAKLLYHQVRPWMMDDGPERLDKNFDFGMPSGHSFTATIVAQYIWDKLLNRKGLEYKERFFNVMSGINAHNNDSIEEPGLDPEDKHQSSVKSNDNVQRKDNIMTLSVRLEEKPIKSVFAKILIIFLLAFYTVFVMISRVFLAAHTIPQVILGFLYGYAYGAGLIFYCRDNVCFYFLKILQNKYSSGRSRLCLIIFNTVTMLSSTGLSIALYYQAQYQSKDDVAKAMINIRKIWEKNNEEPKPFYSMFEAAHLDHTLQLLLMCSFVYILILPGRKGYVYNQDFFSDQWCKKFFLRLLIVIVCCAIPFVLVSVIPKKLLFDKQYFGLYEQTRAVGISVLPIFYPFISSWIFKKCNIQILGDLMNY